MGHPDGRPAATAGAAWRIGIWSDLSEGTALDALGGRVIVRELAARLPDGLVEARVATLGGAVRPGPRDGGSPPEVLGAWSTAAADAVAGELDAALVVAVDLAAAPTGGSWAVEGLGLAEGSCPVVWCGVRAAGTMTERVGARLRRAAPRRLPIGAEGEDAARNLKASGLAGEDLTVLPPWHLLAGRLYSAELLAKRLGFLRLMGWMAPDGITVLVDATAPLDRTAVGAALAGLAEGMADLHVVMAEVDPLGVPSRTSAAPAGFPPGTPVIGAAVGMEDLCAAVAAASLVIGGPPLCDLADALGTPRLRLGDGDPSPAPGPGLAATIEGALAARRVEERSEEVAALDGYLDRLAAALASAIRGGEDPSATAGHRVQALEDRLALVEAAHAARSRRLATERTVFASHLHKAEEDLRALRGEIDHLRQAVQQAQEMRAEADTAVRAEAASRAAAEAELIALRATRTFRYTADLRAAYGRLRRFGQPEITVPRR